MSRSIFAALFLILTQHAQAESLKSVRIDFIEALAPRDTTSSDRFEKDYRETIQLGALHLKDKLASCGYTLETKIDFYEANDALKAKELAAKSESNGSWLIIGPRRSNHYMLLAQGASATPTISLMAGADDLPKLGRLHISLSPTNSEMARIAAQEAHRLKGAHASYMTVVSDDCTNCIDFSKAFDTEAARIGLKKLDELKVRGESFDTAQIVHSIQTKKPAFVLLPNYSIVSGSIMSAFKSIKQPPLFVGGDGWGDNKYGFVQNGQSLNNVEGITVRGLPPIEQGMARFTLGKSLLKTDEAPLFAASMGILKVLDALSETLCQSRPTSKTEFTQQFERSSNKALRAPWGVSLFRLKSGELTFVRNQVLR